MQLSGKGLNYTFYAIVNEFYYKISMSIRASQLRIVGSRRHEFTYIICMSAKVKGTLLSKALIYVFVWGFLYKQIGFFIKETDSVGYNVV